MCIYCDADSADLTLYRQIPHAVAEAVMHNDITLPQGFMCDDCNGYFGATLEPELIRHPSIAWAIQKAKVPGKAGRVRSVVGNIVRDEDPGSGFHVDIAPFEVSKNAHGAIEVTVLPLLDPNFHLLRFRRALHLVAFNCLAYHYGTAEALDPIYDVVRTYIRRPARRDEAWPFAVVFDPAHGHAVDVELFMPSELGTIVRVGLYTHNFYVDLLNTGRLDAWAGAKGLSPLQLVSSTDDYPQSPKTRPRASNERYTLGFSEGQLPPM